MDRLKNFKQHQRAQGLAAILAIGTANPPNVVNQDEYPDYYFRVTKGEHMTALKEKFSRLCERSKIEKRHMFITEDIIKQHPELAANDGKSTDVRNDMLMTAVPKLGEAAALKAIEEWGRPKSDITHLIFSTNAGGNKSGTDYQLIKLLELSPYVKRVMLYDQGSFAGGTVLRIAKDLAENTAGSRVLVVCSEISLTTFRGPSEEDMSCLVSQTIFGDGAAAMIIGADPIESVEHPIFHIVSTMEKILPNSEGTIEGHIKDVGLTFHLSHKVPTLIGNNIKELLANAFNPFGIDDWNSIFWVPHAGGRALLSQIEDRLMLEGEKLRASKKVLREYGNMASASVIFSLEEMRKQSAVEMMPTTGEGLDWGVLLEFGPGLTVETVVLRSVPIA